MAITLGHVVEMIWESEAVCVYVGTSMTSSELLTLEFTSGDDPFTIAHKRMLANLLATGFTSGREVQVGHDDQDARIDTVSFPGAVISPVGPAIHGDFYSITGTDFADPVILIFEKGPIEVAVLPEVRRRHWLMVERLPANVPTGRCLVSVWAPEISRRSARVPVDVSAGAPLTVRTLYPGRPAPDPYTIVMAATPAHVRGQVIGPAGETIPWVLEPDPVLTNRAGFMTLVRKALDGLLKFDGAVLDTARLEASVRFVSIFDPTQGATSANALVVTTEPNLIGPGAGSVLKAFTGRYAQGADIVFCVTSMSTYTRASARWTTDDPARAQVTYTYDAVDRTFGRYASVPGAVALSTFDDSSLTALHEFCHAAGDLASGMIWDLYVDAIPAGAFVVNKKARAKATDAIPATFCTFSAPPPWTPIGSGTFASDLGRDGLGYPAGWTSYHQKLLSPSVPNLMDESKASSRLDELTFEFLVYRLRAKILR